jgi:allophanate hydrolase subunit 2
MQGRALRKDDELAALPSGPVSRRRVAATAIPDYTGEPSVRAILGPQADRFTDAGIRALFEGRYEVLPQSDRMGSRLRGPRIEHARGHDIVSDGIALGSIQVPGDGQPIVLLVDRQSTGGYTKMATICSSDIWRVGQARPGQSLRFRRIGVEEAHRLLRESDAALEAAVREEIA